MASASDAEAGERHGALPEPRGVGGTIVDAGEREPRLHLVARQALLLRLELFDRNGCEVVALRAPGSCQPRPERLDARVQLRDAVGEGFGVVRHVLACLLAPAASASPSA